MKRFDCVLIVDSELSEMAERQLTRLLRLHASGEIRTGIVTLWHARTTLGWLTSSEIAGLIDGELLSWLDPRERYHADLALVLSPGLAHVAPARVPGITAETVMIWPIEPPRRGQPPLFELAPDLAGRIGERLGSEPIWCARTASERHHLAREAIGLDLAPVIWWPLLGDPDKGEDRPDDKQRFRVGRHWQDDRRLGPHARKELAEAFSDPWPFDIALHGDRSLLQSLPAFHQSQGASLIDGGRVPRQDFLGELSLFAALGTADDPFGLPFEVFEAFAEDVLVIGPSYLASALDAPLPSADPAEMSGLAAHFMSDDRAYREAIDRQRQLRLERHADFVYRARINGYLGKSTGRNEPKLRHPKSRRRDRVLFVSDDSLHLEHLSRVLAVADQLPGSLEPFFATTGRDAWLAEERGHPVEFITAHNSPSYRETGHGADGWNFWFERQFAELLAFVSPRAVVFDGVYPFGGMMANRKRYPDLRFIWMRQPLWRPNAKRDALALGSILDLVIEPGDLAADFDRGPTVAYADNVLSTSPILTADLLPRNEARKLLGIGADDIAILLDDRLPAEVLASDAVGVLLKGLIEGGATLWAFDHQQPEASNPALGHPGLKTMADPKALRCRSAFDGAISGADYRGLHDQAAARLPTIFIAGLGSSTDDQAARIAYAEGQGWAQALRQRDVYAARDAVDRLLDADRRQAMVGGFESESFENGAHQAALAISATVFGLALSDISGDGMADLAADAAD